MNSLASLSSPVAWNTPEFQRRVNALRAVDNRTNWLHLAREHLFLAAVIGLALAFDFQRQAWGRSWLWDVPVMALAVVLVGAGQHRLSTLGHEGSHYTLFRNRLLNELVSDWFCMFPLFSTTHHYRLQHLAHHQYPNDPERDPDIAQLEASGHRYPLPMPPRRFVWACMVKPVLWLPGLVRYVRGRARYAAVGGAGPYSLGGPRPRLLVRVGAAYILSQVVAVNLLAWLGRPWLLALVPAGLWAATTALLVLAPSRWFSRSLLKPDVPMRWMSCLRIAHMTLVFTTLGWLTYLTGKPWFLFYMVLWVAPLVTSFSFFMLLRQVVQHGNADRGRLTNTRVFRVGCLIRWAVFPLGMDYHLPHHLFPLVPHYRLRELHALLLENAAYREQGRVADGYFFPQGEPPTNPTVLDLMAEPAPRG